MKPPPTWIDRPPTHHEIARLTGLPVWRVWLSDLVDTLWLRWWLWMGPP